MNKSRKFRFVVSHGEEEKEIGLVMGTEKCIYTRNDSLFENILQGMASKLTRSKTIDQGVSLEILFQFF